MVKDRRGHILHAPFSRTQSLYSGADLRAVQSQSESILAVLSKIVGDGYTWCWAWLSGFGGNGKIHAMVGSDMATLASGSRSISGSITGHEHLSIDATDESYQAVVEASLKGLLPAAYAIETFPNRSERYLSMFSQWEGSDGSWREVK